MREMYLARIFIFSVLLAVASQSTAGNITGYVAVDNIQVEFFDALNADLLGTTVTDTNGAYDSGDLPDGNYRIRFSDTGAHAPGFYRPKFFGDGSDDFCMGTVVAVAGTSSVLANDVLKFGDPTLVVLRDFVFLGTVTDASSGGLLQGIDVILLNGQNGKKVLKDDITTDAIGQYSVSLIQDNTPSIRIRFHDPSTKYFPEFFEDGGNGSDDFCAAPKFGEGAFKPVDGLLDLIPPNTVEVIDEVEDLGLPDKVASNLTTPLLRAVELISDGNDPNNAGACAQFIAFLSRVDLQERKGEITTQQADELRVSAAAVMAELGCTDGIPTTSPVVISPTTATIAPLGVISFSASGGDGNYSYSMFANNSNGNITSTGMYTAGTTGGVMDTVRVADGSGGVADATVTVASALSINPSSPSVPPLGSVSFSATVGGVPPYFYSIHVNNSLGYMVDNLYYAGPTGSVIDTVRVTDANGAVSEATVTVGPAVSISPDSVVVPPGGIFDFNASGGDGMYTFSLVIINSGGHVNENTGVYTAGFTGGVNDVVRVTDGLGGVSEATVTVGPNLSISPTVATVAPGESVSFSATGGAGDYAFSMFLNPSGGSISSTGTYTAGGTAGVTDTIRLTDGVGTFVHATVSVEFP